jgi:hypothetical protein
VQTVRNAIHTFNARGLAALFEQFGAAVIGIHALEHEPKLRTL